MTQDANHLVWLDMEMTGLEPERDRIIELAMIVTDSQLTTIAESTVWVYTRRMPASMRWTNGTGRRTPAPD
jgi:oligoribonuclease (3'-5' exoribonuclease)